MFKNILVPIDGSEPSHHAMHVASDIANQYDAKLILAHVLFRGVSFAKVSDTAKSEGFLDEIENDLTRDSIIELVLENRTGC